MADYDSDFYSRYAHGYHRNTFFIDPTPFLEPLTRFVKPPAMILDVGCASGRDLLWFKQRGYTVLGLERSSTLAAMARKNVGCRVIEADFQSYEFSTLQVDAVILIGALVHLMPTGFFHALDHICRSVKPRGFVLLSAKAGSGFKTGTDGRTFYLWQHGEIEEVFDELEFEIMNYAKLASQLGAGEKWLTYILRKSAKRKGGT